MSRSRRRLFVRSLTPLIAVVSAALMVTGAPVVSVATASPDLAAADLVSASSASTASTATDDASSRPDSVSAAVTARVSGHRVEDLSQHTDTARVFANPDGTWTAEATTEPAYVQDAAGTWHDVDPTLVERDGHWVPRYAATDMALSDGGDTTFASLTEDGQKVDWHWPTTLPTPVVDGNVATYPDAVPGGGDLVVTATATGFSHDIVLHQAPAAAENGKDPAWTIPVATHGADLDATSGGGLVITDPDHGGQHGQQIATAAPPVMYDAAGLAPGQDITDPTVDPTADPATDTAVLDTTVGQNAAGTPTMTLSADARFLTDPATVYPVVIDPSFTVTPSGDTWVDSQSPTNEHASSVALEAGYNGSYATRSFLAFDWTAVSNLASKDVVSASLKMRNYNSLSCAGSEIRAQRVTEPWTVGISWNTQPGFTTSGYASYTPAHGGTNCATDWATWDLTDIVSYWAAHPAENYGIRIKAADETTTASWREYRSVNYTTTSYRPTLAVTYNTAPNKPSAPTVTTSPGSNTGYSISTTPTFKATVSDPDKGQVRAKFEVYQGSTLVWSGYSPYVSSGGTATLKSGALTNGVAYTVKATANDGIDSSVSASTATSFSVDTSKPTVVINSTGFTDSTWSEDPPASNSFTFNGSPDTKSFSYSLDGVTQPTKTADANGNATITWLPKNGAHQLYVTATDKAGNTGPTAGFVFGVGQAEFTDLGLSPQSTGVFPLDVEGPPDATSVDLSWRYAGQTDSKWASLTGITTQGGDPWAATDVTTVGGSSNTPRLLWDAANQEDPAKAGEDVTTIEAPSLLQLRACFHYASGAAQVCSVTQQLQLVPSAFAGNFPVAEVGAATVALYTGEMSYDEGDAIDTSAGVGRSFATFDPATARPGPFGPGWSTSLETEGDTDASLVDHRNIDRTFVLVTSGGSTQMFSPNDPDIDPSTATGEVLFKPTGQDDGSRLALDGSTVTLTRPHGPVTTWTRDTATGDWLPSQVALAASAGDPDANMDFARPNYPSWIAQTPPGESPTCTATVQEGGCRGLKFSYSGTGAEQRIDHIDLIAAGADPVRLATYTYDSNGLLTQVCGQDPDGNGIEQALCTTYAYDTTTVVDRTLLKTVTPAGQAPWTFTYDSRGRLIRTTRALDPDTNTDPGAANWTVVYNLNTTADGLPDMTAATAARWGQNVAPSHVYAVFDPSHVPAATPTVGDLEYAKLWYTDDKGQTTNTTVHGNVDGDSQWLVDTTWYDEHGNDVRDLDGAGRARVLAASSEDQATVAMEASSYTIYNDTGDRVEDEYTSVRTATLQDGTTGPFRSHTAYTYDDEAPDLGGGDKPDLSQGQDSFNLVVEETVSTADADMTASYDSVVIRNNYNPIVAGDGNSWDLGTPTQVLTKMEDGSWSTATSRYDTEGRLIESRQPGGSTAADGSGNDAHATITSYYAPGAADPDCTITGVANRVNWDGLVCKERPATQPAGIPIPVTYYADYDADLNAARVEETSGTTTRVTTTTYDDLDRPTGTEITDGTDTRSSTVAYDPATGQQTSATGPDGTVTLTYDTWGRPWTYTDATGQTSVTTYTNSGQTATFNDGTGTYTYTYDQPTGEHRGLPTTVDTGAPAGATFTIDYDANASPATINYPNGLKAKYHYEEAGNPVSLQYQDATDDELLTFTNTLNADGKTVANSSPDSQQSYDFDNLGRLTTTQDTRTNGCTTRSYGFSASSDRTTLTNYAPGSDGSCQTSSAAATRTNTYDTAGRFTSPGYTYDALGRTLTIPAVDTAAGAQSPLSARYYANDMVRSLNQTVDDGNGGSTEQQTNYGLDPTGRINTITNKTVGTETSTLHYSFSDDTDAPTRIDTTTPAGSSSTRYLTLPGIGMIGSVTDGAVNYDLANLHGDTIATSTAGSSAVSIDRYADTDEYGNVNPVVETHDRYQWLGSHQRSSDSVGGMVLMGVRLYNPATGSFLTPDPVPGGNVTPYTYPQDPINGTDLTGQICIMGWGNCAYDFHRFTGSVVHATDGVMGKIAREHNIHNVNLVSWVIYHMRFHSLYWLEPGSRAPYYTNYRVLLRRVRCSVFYGCQYTGQYVEFVVSVNWFDGRSGHGRLRTMYCNNMYKCPDWVNHVSLV